jgi:hypothetical protein
MRRRSKLLSIRDSSTSASISQTSSAASSVQPPTKTESAASARCSSASRRSYEHSMVARSVRCRGSASRTPFSMSSRRSGMRQDRFLDLPLTSCSVSRTGWKEPAFHPLRTRYPFPRLSRRFLPPRGPVPALEVKKQVSGWASSLLVRIFGRGLGPIANRGNSMRREELTGRSEKQRLANGTFQVRARRGSTSPGFGEASRAPLRGRPLFARLG